MHTLKKYLKFMLLTWGLNACGSASGNEADKGPEIASAAAEPGQNLTFFTGSVSTCTEELKKAGHCNEVSAPLSRCIKLSKTTTEDLKCKVATRALFKETETGFTKEVRDFQTVTLHGAELTTCFDFKKDAGYLWKFQQFNAFEGHCQKEVDEPIHCQPESEKCSSFKMDPSTCRSGWPCVSLESKKSSFTACTDILAKKGLCELASETFTGCMDFRNTGSAMLSCDFRLDINSHEGHSLAVVKGQRLYPLQVQTICFKYPDRVEAVKGPRSLAAVCQPYLDEIVPLQTCDLAQDLCQEQTLQTLTFIN